MTVDIYLDHYDPILQALMKWRVVPTAILKDVSGYQGELRSFNRVIKKLESKRLIKCMRFNGATKLIYPTNDLIQILDSKMPFIHEDSVTHDGLTSIVVNELLLWEIFNEAKFPHEILEDNYYLGLKRFPDAILKGSHKGKSFNLALEVELSRKSKLRVRNKLDDYSSNRVFNYVFYLFNNRNVYEGYSRILQDFVNAQLDTEMKNEIRSRFILGLRENIIHHKFKLDNAEIFYQGKITKLENIFGKKSDATSWANSCENAVPTTMGILKDSPSIRNS